MRNRTRKLGSGCGVFEGLAALSVAIGLLIPLVPAEAISLPKSGLGDGQRVPSYVTRVAVFGKDERIPLPARLKSLEGSVGLLYDQQTRTVCSAFCVGDDIVATAGHCLYGTDHERAPKLAGFTFRLPALKQSTPHTDRWNTRRRRQPVCHLGIDRALDAASDRCLARLGAGPDREAHVPGQCLALERCVARRGDRSSQPRSASTRSGSIAISATGRSPTVHPCSLRRSFDGADWDRSPRISLRPATCCFTPVIRAAPHPARHSSSTATTARRWLASMSAPTCSPRFCCRMDRSCIAIRRTPLPTHGVAVAAIRDKLEAFERADILATRQDLRRLQIRLAQYGHYSGPRDGAYGPRLRGRHRKFRTRAADAWRPVLRRRSF